MTRWKRPTRAGRATDRTNPTLACASGLCELRAEQRIRLRVPLPNASSGGMRLPGKRHCFPDEQYRLTNPNRLDHRRTPISHDDSLHPDSSRIKNLVSTPQFLPSLFFRAKFACLCTPRRRARPLQVSGRCELTHAGRTRQRCDGRRPSPSRPASVGKCSTIERRYELESGEFVVASGA